jgi:hypothetical protein
METPNTDPAATPVPAVEGEEKLSKKYEHFSFPWIRIHVIANTWHLID